MKKKILDNLGLKIISLVAAIILWILVTAINNPYVSRTFYNIPVQLINTNKITDSGKVYKILDDTATITRVTVRAPHSVISELRSDNIVAIADVNGLSSLDTVSIKLDTNIYSDQISSITGSIDTVKLGIENKKTKTLALTTNITGEVSEGYLLGDVTTDQNLIIISGAESVVDSITRATAEVDVSGFTSDIGTNVEIKLYDADSNPVNDESITKNIKTVGVDVAILQTKEVPVLFTVEGEAAPGYRATGVYEQDKLNALICGKIVSLKNVDSISIPKEAVNISDQRSDYTAEIDIRNYLPDGVGLVNTDDPIYRIKVYIEAEANKHIGITADDVSVINLPDGYVASVSLENNTMIELVGLNTDLNELNKNTLNPTVDVGAWMTGMGITEIEDGFYNITIDFAIPSTRVTLVDPITATVHIEKR